MRVYAGGGYRYPHDDLARLSDEMRRIADLGYTHAKIKIGGADLDQDRRRIEAAATQLADSSHLAVDAMNTYDATTVEAAAAMLAPFDLWWFEDICDPLDLPLQADIATRYAPPIAAGEALFSLAEAKLLDRYGGLRPERDVLVFDPVHGYGLPGYLQIVEHFASRGWRRDAFWPHGGHLFSLHVVAALSSAVRKSVRSRFIRSADWPMAQALTPDTHACRKRRASASSCMPARTTCFARYRAADACSASIAKRTAKPSIITATKQSSMRHASVRANHARHARAPYVSIRNHASEAVIAPIANGARAAGVWLTITVPRSSTVSIHAYGLSSETAAVASTVRERVGSLPVRGPSTCSGCRRQIAERSASRP